MFKNYLKTAFRNLTHHKGYSLINIAGFAIGIACCILILLWVQDELSFDRFHENLDSLHRVVEEQHYSDGTIFPIARTPYPVGPALVADYPEIITAQIKIYPVRRIYLYQKSSQKVTGHKTSKLLLDAGFGNFKLK